MAAISLVIPVYNNSLSDLERAFESVRIQRVPMRVIVVDDGSNSEVASYLDAVDVRPHSKQVLHKDNGGVSSARNAGLELVNTEYVAFMDADDVLMEDYVFEALEFAEYTRADVVFGGWVHEYLDGSAVVTTQTFGQENVDYYTIEGEEIDILIQSLFDEDALTQIGLGKRRYVSNCAALYRASIIGKMRFPTGIAISEDRMFNYEVFKRCARVCLTGKVWYRYIQNEGSASNRLRANAKDELSATADVFYSYLKHDGSPYDESIYRGILACFGQAINFSVLRKGFVTQAHMGRLAYVRQLMSIPVFAATFREACPTKASLRLVCKLGRSRLSLAMLTIYKIRSVVGAVKRRKHKRSNG